MKQIKELEKFLTNNENLFQEAFGHLGETQLNFKPDSFTWSIAQNVEHLIKINSSFFPIFEQLFSETYQKPWTAHIPGYAPLVGRMVLNSVNPDRKKKMKTQGIWEPSHSITPGDALARFKSNHSKIMAWATKLGPEFKSTPIPSPASKLMVYPLDTLWDIICVHEVRHFKQAQALLPLIPMDDAIKA
jgi:hypothetical protein